MSLYIFNKYRKSTGQTVDAKIVQLLHMYAAVAPAQQIASSPDGINWTTRTFPFSGGECRGGVWVANLGMFVFVGIRTSISANGRAVISTDGITWTDATLNVGNHTGEAVTYSPSLGLLLATTGSGSMSTSPNGTTWTQVTTPGFSGTSIKAACWSPGLGLFAVGGASGKIATSPDATTWTQRTTGLSGEVNDICWSPSLGLFLAVTVITTGSGAVATSPDGINWTLRTGSQFQSNGARTCSWSPSLGKFIIGGYNNALSYSSDGINWTDITVGGGVITTIAASCWSAIDSQFVIGSAGPVYTSSNASSWTQRNAPFPFFEIQSILASA
jgi:hypothetical protein